MSSGIASGAVAQIPPNTPIIATATINSTSGVTLYTVPAGRTFYCTGAVIVADGGTYEMYIRIDSTDIITVKALNATPVNLSGQLIFAADAGEVVKGRMGSGATSGYMTIWGYIL